MTTKSSGFSIENNVLKGDVVPIPCDFSSLGDFILDRFENNPDIAGIIDAVTGKKYTYKKMREQSIRCALWMKSQGIVPGDVVAISSHNQPDLTTPCFAALYLGAIFTPWDATLNAKSFCHFINGMKPKIAFANEEAAQQISKAAKEVGIDLKIVVFERLPGFLEFDKIIEEIAEEEIENFRPTKNSSLTDIAVILSSSGTTGLPKGVALTHGGFLRQMQQSHELGMPGNVCLLFTTLAWITATLNIFQCLYLNTPRLVAPPFEVESACAIIEKHKVNWALFAPSMINSLLKSGAANRYDLSSLKRLVCGGAMLSAASRQEISEVLPNIKVSACYGMTELGSYITIQTSNCDPRSCGRIMENCEITVLDVRSGEKLGPKNKGELLLKTPYMMKGYFNNPQASAEAVDKEGWMHSGDLGYYDENGEVFFIDRLKELIKYRGFHISPYDVENIITTHPGVEEALVVGKPHPVDDEHPIAFVVKKPGRKVTETEIIDYVDSMVPDSKRLRAGVRFVEFIPKTTSNKPKRMEFRTLARSMATD